MGLAINESSIKFQKNHRILHKTVVLRSSQKLKIYFIEVPKSLPKTLKKSVTIIWQVFNKTEPLRFLNRTL
ncbi:hypothetical protein FF021_16980 [Leptospira noguchii]|nr:hypothetical protein FF021_16980 [Leptospira noguchii]